MAYSPAPKPNPILPGSEMFANGELMGGTSICLFRAGRVKAGRDGEGWGKGLGGQAEDES